MGGINSKKQEDDREYKEIIIPNLDKKKCFITNIHRIKKKSIILE